MKPIIFLVVAFVVLLCASSAFASCETPTGPELAKQQLGYLLRAYPIAVQTNPQNLMGVGTTLWGCKYKVGRALITVTISTNPSDPMPCKRKVAFK